MCTRAKKKEKKHKGNNNTKKKKMNLKKEGAQGIEPGLDARGVNGVTPVPLTLLTTRGTNVKYKANFSVYVNLFSLYTT